MIERNEMTTYIYARTSTTDQNVDQQVAELQKQAPADSVIYKEQLSGKTTNRPSFNEMIDKVVSGDTILVLSVSRLGRNTGEVINFVGNMKDKGVSVKVSDLGGLDITSTTGKLVMTTLSAVAEMQRDEMLEKQRIGIERAKREGKYQGKKQTPATIKKCKEALGYVDGGMSKEKAAKAVGIGVATLYRYIKEQ